MPRNDGWEIEDEAWPHGMAGFDAAVELAELPYVRLTQRAEPPRNQRDRRKFWTLLALVVLAHAVLACLLYLALRPVPRHPGANVIAVTLIEPTAELPPPPPLVAPPPLQGQPAPAAPPPPRRHYVPPAKGAISATMENSQGKSLDLYGANGEVRLPPGTPAPASTPAYITPGLKGSQIYSGKSPLPYTPTRFAKDFEPTNQSLGQKTVGRAVKKVMEKTTVQKTIHLPGGIKVHCAVSLLALGGGCKGDAPPPPPKNDDDIRLSLPPAETLTGKKVVVPELEHPGEQGKDRKPCRLQSHDAQTTRSAREACRNSQSLPASGRS